jgi:hypothetical protein
MSRRDGETDARGGGRRTDTQQVYIDGVETALDVAFKNEGHGEVP